MNLMLHFTERPRERKAVISPRSLPSSRQEGTTIRSQLISESPVISQKSVGHSCKDKRLCY